MANGHQMQQLIDQATERVAREGRGVDQSDLMLAGFGYLAHEIQKPQWHSIRRVVPTVFALGGALGAGVLAGVARLLGWHG